MSPSTTRADIAPRPSISSGARFSRCASGLPPAPPEPSLPAQRRGLVDLDQGRPGGAMGLLQLLLQMGQAVGPHRAAAEAARDGQEVRGVDVDADLRDAALGHVFLDLAVA